MSELIEQITKLNNILEKSAMRLMTIESAADELEKNLVLINQLLLAILVLCGVHFLLFLFVVVSEQFEK